MFPLGTVSTLTSIRRLGYLQLVIYKAMWYKDTPGHQYKRKTDNKGFTSRKALTAQSKSVQMMGKLHLDLFCQEKYLLNHVALKINM
jgi:hypothetical protein